MNIIVLSNMYPNSVMYRSGIFVHEQVKELIKLGVNVTVIAPIAYSPKLFSGFKSKWKDYSLIPYEENIDNIKIYHPRFIAIPKGYLKGYWGYVYAFTAGKIMKKILKRESIDVLHAHGSLPDDFGTYLISKKFNIPYLLTVHGASVYAVQRIKTHFEKSKIAIINANRIVGVSKVILKRIEKFTGRKDKVSCIYNGYKKNDLSINSNKKKANEIRILFAGSLIERKGIRYLIKAFEELIKKYSNIKLIVAGGGVLEDEMQKLSRDFKIDMTVEFTGVISHSEMLNKINNCDIFILPSWDEAFGVVYLEAMSMLKPVIGTAEEGISDFIIDGENGLLVKSKDSKSIVEKLSILIENENLRKEFGEKGYKVIKDLTWEKNAQETFQIYKAILDEVKSV